MFAFLDGRHSTISTLAPMRSGEMARSAMHLARNGKLQRVFQVGVPAHGLLFWAVGIDHDLVGYALLRAPRLVRNLVMTPPIAA